MDDVKRTELLVNVPLDVVEMNVSCDRSGTRYTAALGIAGLDTPMMVEGEVARQLWGKAKVPPVRLLVLAGCEVDSTAGLIAGLAGDKAKLIDQAASMTAQRDYERKVRMEAQEGHEDALRSYREAAKERDQQRARADRAEAERDQLRLSRDALAAQAVKQTERADKAEDKIAWQVGSIRNADSEILRLSKALDATLLQQNEADATAAKRLGQLRELADLCPRKLTHMTAFDVVRAQLERFAEQEAGRNKEAARLRAELDRSHAAEGQLMIEGKRLATEQEHRRLQCDKAVEQRDAALATLERERASARVAEAELRAMKAQRDDFAQKWTDAKANWADSETDLAVVKRERDEAREQLCKLEWAGQRKGPETNRDIGRLVSPACFICFGCKPDTPEVEKHFPIDCIGHRPTCWFAKNETARERWKNAKAAYSSFVFIDEKPGRPSKLGAVPHFASGGGVIWIGGADFAKGGSWTVLSCEYWSPEGERIRVVDGKAVFERKPDSDRPPKGTASPLVDKMASLYGRDGAAGKEAVRVLDLNRPAPKFEVGQTIVSTGDPTPRKIMRAKYLGGWFYEDPSGVWADERGVRPVPNFAIGQSVVGLYGGARFEISEMRWCSEASGWWTYRGPKTDHSQCLWLPEKSLLPAPKFAVGEWVTFLGSVDCEVMRQWHCDRWAYELRRPDEVVWNAAEHELTAQTPQHKHDCAGCVFLGRWEGKDLYWCKRHNGCSAGSVAVGDGWLSCAGCLAAPVSVDHIEARRRARARGLM